ncbi:uncharacterized protein [Ptychodera flava]|uniref:uncharacterized protein n=1 Tax=Ptychodera flava TaxID=63121 RepID=UPI003969C9FF
MTTPSKVILSLVFLALLFQPGSCDSEHNITAGIAIVTTLGVLIFAVYLTGCIVAWKNYGRSPGSSVYQTDVHDQGAPSTEEVRVISQQSGDTYKENNDGVAIQSFSAL